MHDTDTHYIVHKYAAHMAEVATLRQLRQWVLGRIQAWNHTVHINQLNKINF